MADFPDDADESRLVVSGEVDIASVDDLLADARTRLEVSTGPLEVDLSGVTFIDSSGLGALVRVRNEARDVGRSLVLVRLSPAVRRVFEISGLDQAFDIRDGA